MTYDLVVRNGTVIDGTGEEGFRADVGIVGDRIAEIGVISDRGKSELDAEGRVVTPGFIDGHTHMDAQINWDPLGASSCWHGVTTVVMGNCGFTLAPVLDDERALVVRNLERAEDISAAAMNAGIDWRWQTFPEYLDVLENLPKGINYAANIGHSALRTWVMGERAFESAANDDDLVKMEGQLRAALEAGAIGFSTSRSDQHETSDDRPVASRLAAWSEVERLVGVLRDHGAGIFELAVDGNIRSEDPAERAEVCDQLFRLVDRYRVPTTFGAFAAHRGTEDLLALVDRAGSANLPIVAQTHPRGLLIVLSFETQLPFDRLPVWRDIRARTKHEQLSALRDPAVRAELVKQAREATYGRAIGTEARPPDFERLYLFDSPLPPFRTVAEAAASLGIDPVELMIERAIDTDFKQLFLQPPMLRPTDDQLLDVLNLPHTVMTFSDSGAHVSQIVDSSIQSHLFAYWVRQQEAISLERAVQMVTACPARVWGFTDRGAIKVGQIADLNVFDPETIAPAMPEVVDDLPAGGRRLSQKSVGFAAIVVAGRILIKDGDHTGALPGKLLRGAPSHGS